jgi:hypothetical protein
LCLECPVAQVNLDPLWSTIGYLDKLVWGEGGRLNEGSQGVLTTRDEVVMANPIMLKSLQAK